MLPSLNEEYWNNRYHEGSTGWDMGCISPPIQAYVDQLEDKDLKILIPGCGSGYEGEYLHKAGFKQVYLMDFAPEPLDRFSERVPDFPMDHLITGNFFEHEQQYDLIVEQTFFCALNPSLRPDYVRQMHRLIKPGGRLVGLLFNDALFSDHPPFGGFKADYEALFASHFELDHLDIAENSIPPRQGRELWIRFLRKDVPA